LGKFLDFRGIKILSKHYSLISLKMKTKNSRPRTTKSLSVTVPAELVPEIDRAAKAQGRTRSSFLAWLILKQKMIDQI
jgi:CopG-like RHH_1 or ribbon-helix-helix domain, RHH_5